MSRFLSGFLTALTTMALLFAAQPSHAGDDSGKFKPVLLISIDGMHAVDFINCSKGINGGAPYCPNLAKLAKKGVTYQDKFGFLCILCICSLRSLRLRCFSRRLERSSAACRSSAFILEV
jgi:hypothetical protein